MDLSKIPEKGTLVIGDTEVNYFREDNLIRVPVEETVLLPMLVDGTVVAKEVRFKVVTIAKCDPRDKFSLKYGVRKAYSRALEKLCAKVDKAERRSGMRLPSQIIAAELSQVKNELKAMEAKFERAKARTLEK